MLDLEQWVVNKTMNSNQNNFKKSNKQQSIFIQGLGYVTKDSIILINFSININKILNKCDNICDRISNDNYKLKR